MPATALGRVRTAGASISPVIGGLAIVLAGWWLLAQMLDPVQLPAPATVWSALLADWNGIAALQYVGFQTGGIRDGILYTTQNVLVGAGIGTALGIAIGTLVGASRTATAVLGPPLLVLGATPVLVVLPFILIWFGTNALAQSMLVIFFTLVTVAAVAQLAVTQVEQHYVNFARCLGAGHIRTFIEVICPAVTPAIIGAVRVSVALGWSFATVSELIGGQRGAGKIIQVMAQLQRTADVIATILALAAVAVLVDMVIAAVGRWLVRWQE